MCTEPSGFLEKERGMTTNYVTGTAGRAKKHLGVYRAHIDFILTVTSPTFSRDLSRSNSHCHQLRSLVGTFIMLLHLMAESGGDFVTPPTLASEGGGALTPQSPLPEMNLLAQVEQPPPPLGAAGGCTWGPKK
ncbi:hypothetical protein EJB05_31786, partial [Eragrostis curvula]